MKLVSIVFALPIVALLGGCMSEHEGPGPAANVDVSANYYDGYYDGYYGPFYDGYWGDDGYFWYADGGHKWHRDEGHHFARSAQSGFNPVHGSGVKREH
jgi:hypothetical protein